MSNAGDCRGDGHDSDGRRVPSSSAAGSSFASILRGQKMISVNRLPKINHKSGLSVPGLRSDAFTLRAEVLEIRRKPSYPIGELTIDAFGNEPVFEDRGVRTRLLLNLGRRDVGSPDFLFPRDPRISVIGASSDHLICEAEEPCADLGYGSVLEFDLMYGAMLYSSDDPYVEVEYV